MKLKVLEGECELTAISFVNGVLIGIDENAKDDYDSEDDVEKKPSIPKKRLKKKY